MSDDDSDYREVCLIGAEVNALFEISAALERIADALERAYPPPPSPEDSAE